MVEMGKPKYSKSCHRDRSGGLGNVPVRSSRVEKSKREKERKQIARATRPQGSQCSDRGEKGEGRLGKGEKLYEKKMECAGGSSSLLRKKKRWKG